MIFTKLGLRCVFHSPGILFILEKSAAHNFGPMQTFNNNNMNINTNIINLYFYSTFQETQGLFIHNTLKKPYTHKIKVNKGYRPG